MVINSFLLYYNNLSSKYKNKMFIINIMNRPSVTYLSNCDKIKISKRTMYHVKNGIKLSLTTRNPISLKYRELKINSDLETNQAKETLFMFSRFFKEFPSDFLNNDANFIMAQKDFILRHPQYCKPIYLQCFELMLKNRKLTYREINHVFSNTAVIDPFNINGEFARTNTVTNLLSITNIQQQSPYMQERITVRDNPKPGRDIIKQLETQYSQEIQQGLTDTNQKIPDLSIQLADSVRLYDIKHTEKIGYQGNKVVPLDIKTLEAIFHRYIGEVGSQLTKIEKTYPKTSLEVRYIIKFRQQINNIINNKKLSIQEKNSLIHKLIINDPGYLKDLKISFLFPTNTNSYKPSMSNYELNKLEMPSNVLEDKKALSKVLADTIKLQGSSAIQTALDTNGLDDSVKNYLSHNEVD